MTENEAIKVLEEIEKHVKIITIDGEPTLCYTTDMVKAFETAIKALEEIKQYRAIYTIEEFKALKDAEEQGLLLRLPVVENTMLKDRVFICPNCEIIL